MRTPLIRRSALFGSLVIAILSGCTTTTTNEPTVADRMRQNAADAQALVDLRNQLASDWERGTALITTGEQRIREGEEKVSEAESNLVEGNAEIEQGQREIEEGRQLVQTSEQRFADNFQDVSQPLGQ